MTLFDLVTEIEDIRTDAADIRALAGVFGDKYTTAYNPADNVLAVQINPEQYASLYHALFGLIIALHERISRLDDQTEPLMEEYREDQKKKREEARKQAQESA